jgi:hypothetical protein
MVVHCFVQAGSRTGLVFDYIIRFVDGLAAAEVNDQMLDLIVLENVPGLWCLWLVIVHLFVTLPEHVWSMMYPGPSQHLRRPLSLPGRLCCCHLGLYSCARGLADPPPSKEGDPFSNLDWCVNKLANIGYATVTLQVDPRQFGTAVHFIVHHVCSRAITTCDCQLP